MEDAIGQAWAELYSNNPKIQAFGVLKSGKVVWQTSNWDLVPVAETLVTAAKSGLPSVNVGGVEYARVFSDDISYIASSNGQGHLLMSLVDGGTWLVAWVSSQGVPELAEIDLAKAALELRDAL
ncbi:MAG: hypothetical protein ACTSPX_06510 [Candidatus Thorarchaeota archaeon]